MRNKKLERATFSTTVAAYDNSVTGYQLLAESQKTLLTHKRKLWNYHWLLVSCLPTNKCSESVFAGNDSYLQTGAIIFSGYRYIRRQ